MISRLRGPALVGVVAAALVACGPINDALESSRGAEPAEDFGAATRERLDSDPEGRTFRVMITANTEADWAEASAAMSKALDFRCVDGESFASINTTPARTADGGIARKHPAGTTFIETYVCDGPLPGEFAIAAGTTPEAAHELVRQLLVGDGELQRERHFITLRSHHDRHRKYATIQDHLGMLIAGAHKRCADGDVVLHRLVIGNYPKPERRRVSLNAAEMMIGTDIECVSRTAAAP